MKLNQCIAVEKGIKNRVTKAVTDIYHRFQKPVLFNGFVKVYKPLVEGNETFPTEKKTIEFKTNSAITDIKTQLTELFDVTATKDYGNCNATADLIVDGNIVMEGVPATYLLFLDKQLVDLRTALDVMPVLDPSKEWTLDKVAGIYKTAPNLTVKTKKVQRPIVMYDATDKHPAQTQLITDDMIVGNWEAVDMSAAVTEEDKQKYVNRIQVLINAVKFAREKANETEVVDKNVGSKLFDWIFNS